MIVYQKAFDLYHTVYRMMKLLAHYKNDGLIEIDRLRIWDYYLLYPNKMDKIRLKREEKDIKTIIRNFILKKEKHCHHPILNSYHWNLQFLKRKTFETPISKKGTFGTFSS